MGKLTKEDYEKFEALKRKIEDVSSDDEKENSKRKKRGTPLKKVKKVKVNNDWHVFQKEWSQKLKAEDPELVKNFPELQRRLSAKRTELGFISKNAAKKHTTALRKKITAEVTKRMTDESESKK
jgi:hypothetical protein